MASLRLALRLSREASEAPAPAPQVQQEAPPARPKKKKPSKRKPKPAAARPNIVLVMSDDQDGNRQRQDYADYLPRHRFLRDHGTTFINHCADSPQCGPSRAATLSGRLPHNTGFLENADSSGASIAGRRTSRGCSRFCRCRRVGAGGASELRGPFSLIQRAVVAALLMRADAPRDDRKETTAQHRTAPFDVCLLPSADNGHRPMHAGSKMLKMVKVRSHFSNFFGSGTSTGTSTWRRCSRYRVAALGAPVSQPYPWPRAVRHAVGSVENRRSRCRAFRRRRWRIRLCARPLDAPEPSGNKNLPSPGSLDFVPLTCYQ